MSAPPRHRGRGTPAAVRGAAVAGRPSPGAALVVTGGLLGWLIGGSPTRTGPRRLPAPDGGAISGAAPVPEDSTATSQEVPAAAAGALGAGDPGESHAEKWIQLATGVIAPTTVLAALLLYFGYVATAAEYGHFGITLGTLGLSTQELALRSVAALYVPLGALLLLLLLAVGIHRTVSAWLATGRRPRLLRLTGLVLTAIGAVALARGVLGVVVPDVARTEPMALSPLSLGLGVTAVAYGGHLRRRTSSGQPARAGPWSRRAELVFTAGLVTLSLFWATNSFAAAYGRGRAAEVADRLQVNRPGITLDTT